MIGIFIHLPGQSNRTIGGDNVADLVGIAHIESGIYAVFFCAEENIASFSEGVVCTESGIR